jgi:hypothetical protein
MQTFKNVIRNENHIHEQIKTRLMLRSACYLYTFTSPTAAAFKPRGKVRATFGVPLALSFYNYIGKYNFNNFYLRFVSLHLCA